MLLPLSFSGILGMGSKETKDTYQQKAVKDMYEKIESILNAKTKADKNKNRILLNAPTGSGKTIISGGLIDLLFYNQPNSTVVWISPQPSLVEQSLSKFSKFYNLHTTFYRGESLHVLQNGEVTGTNWEVLKHNMDTTNKVIHGTEQIKPLKAMMDEYKKTDGKIYLFIDESHHNKEDSKNEQDKTKRILEMIDADVEIFISATPQKNDDRTTEVKIDIDDVRKAGFIKQGIVINDIAAHDNYDEQYRKKNNVKNLTEFYVNESIKKLKVLKSDLAAYAKEYNKEKTVKPLLLINVPDSNTEENKNRISTVLNFLKDKGYTSESGKLINLTNNGDSIDSKLETSYKTLLESLCDDEKAEIVVFKQSIGMGWDCPRASILTFIRDPKTTTLTTQVVGRILRMPYLEAYAGEKYDHLNSGFVYIQNDDNVILENLANEIEDKMKTKMVYHKKSNVDSALDHLQSQLWQVMMANYDVNNEAKKRLEELNWEDVLDLTKTENLVQLSTGNISSSAVYSGVSNITVSKREIGNSSTYDLFNHIQKSLRKYGLLEYELFIYKFIRPIKQKYAFTDIQMLSVVSGNIQVIIDTIQQIIDEVNSENTTHKKVKMPFKLPYYDYTELNKEVMNVSEPNNYTHDKIFAGNKLEKAFTEMLLNDKTVKWFYKNGDFGEKYFKLPYKLGNEYKLFFPDFLVEYEDRVVIYETKGVLATSANEQKVIAMEEYLKEIGAITYISSDGLEVTKNIECYYVSSDSTDYDVFYKYIGNSENYMENGIRFEKNKTGWKLVK